MTTNRIKFTSTDIEAAKGVGSISSLPFVLKIVVEPVASANPMSSTHRQLVECGGIWKKQSKETDADYYTPSIRDHGIKANLSKATNQNDLPLQSAILLRLKDAA